MQSIYDKSLQEELKEKTMGGKDKVIKWMVNKEKNYSKESEDVCSSSNTHTHHSTKSGRKIKKKSKSSDPCIFISDRAQV